MSFQFQGVNKFLLSFFYSANRLRSTPPTLFSTQVHWVSSCQTAPWLQLDCAGYACGDWTAPNPCHPSVLILHLGSTCENHIAFLQVLHAPLHRLHLFPRLQDVKNASICKACAPPIIGVRADGTAGHDWLWFGLGFLDPHKADNAPTDHAGVSNCSCCGKLLSIYEELQLLTLTLCRSQQTFNFSNLCIPRHDLFKQSLPREQAHDHFN
mmetsp:Transcript_32076/g.69259  ORF Transcript_32076/g.69259 Transcript_32076/m.69259 type:complete len:210 (-) Transcript_32076:2073-2702(-)